MMTIRNGCVLVAFAFIANMQSAGIADDEATGPSIVVVVSGLESDRGQVIVNLYNSKKDFPGGADGVVATRRVKIENAKAQCEFEDVASGDYAVAIIHDADANGKLKTNFMGIPKEGTGASNNPKPRFGPPKWADAVFEVRDASIELEIKVQYL